MGDSGVLSTCYQLLVVSPSYYSPATEPSSMSLGLRSEMVQHHSVRLVVEVLQRCHLVAVSLPHRSSLHPLRQHRHSRCHMSRCVQLWCWGRWPGRCTGQEQQCSADRGTQCMRQCLQGRSRRSRQAGGEKHVRSVTSTQGAGHCTSRQCRPWSVLGVHPWPASCDLAPLTAAAQPPTGRNCWLYSACNNVVRSATVQAAAKVLLGVHL